ncbi:MAG: hypothetical protein JNK82_04185 [Myxococcaceae bacterium]|nr:hypothetical protein [Myxococcaceae bacterium]
MVNGIWLALLGVLAVPSLIIAKKPNAKELIAKLTPYQGWIGAISCLWGVWGIISAVLNLGWLTAAPIYWITWLADSVLQFALGLILGIGTLKTFIKNPQAQTKMDETLAKLQPKQGVLGLAAIGVGVWMIVASILFSV